MLQANWALKYHLLCHNNLSFSCKVQLLRNFINAYWPTQACKHQHNTLHWTDHIQFSLVSESGRFGCHTLYKTYFIKRVFSVSKELEESFAAEWPQMTKEQQVRKIIGEQYEGGSSTKTGTHTCAVYAMQQLFKYCYVVRLWDQWKIWGLLHKKLQNIRYETAIRTHNSKIVTKSCNFSGIFEIVIATSKKHSMHPYI